MSTANDDFAKSLRANVAGEVFFDEISRGIYATDASHYQIMPSCVVVPKSAAAAIEAVQLAAAYGVPITPRGGGTSLSGQTTWSGMVLDCSKYLNQILEVNADESWVRVQPGVVCDDLNAHVASLGLQFAPDPATGSRANIGGMVGNNSSGTRSVIYGKTIDHVLSCKVALADGTVLTFAPTPCHEWQAIEASGGRQGELYSGIRNIVEQNREEIIRRYPKVMRRVGGYNLDAFLPEEQGGQPGDWNLSNLIVGSEGTLGVLLETKLRLVPRPKATAVCVVHFNDLIESLVAVAQILQHEPSAVELLDKPVVTEAKTNPTTASMADFVEGTPESVLIVEVTGDNPDEASARIRDLAEDLKSHGIGYAWPIKTTPRGVARVWNVRKLGLGLLMNAKGRRRGQAFIEDACLPIPVLPEYIRKVLAICDRKGVPVTMYAHASVGVLHVRPMLDMHEPADVLRMKEIADAAFDLVMEYGGSWSGEHGDGLLRGEYIPRFFGPKLTNAFREVKRMFDPSGLMNPGKIVDAQPMTENLRYGRDYHTRHVPSLFQYREHGSFELTVEQCSGLGVCRKTGEGTMCPSYMATRDEEHATRGRANALRLAMTGQLGDQALTGCRMKDVLDLCLSCKACKTECPTAVDMARLKSDVLQLRHDKHGTTWVARVVGAIPKFARLSAGRLASVANWLQNRPAVRIALEKITGIDRRRPLPSFADESLMHWWKTRNDALCATNGSTAKRVALFVDTFTNYFEPHVGRAAVELLESCGYRVQLVDPGCCQRPAISQGLLRQAKAGGAATLRRLEAMTAPTTPILVLEPSCASSLTDDLPDLVDDVDLATSIAVRVKMIDVFLAAEVASGRLECEFTATADKILLHGHCHQKALYGTDAMKEILARIPGTQFTEVDSGCCGMAGAFGYSHYDLSKTIGEDRLFPAVRDREEGTTVVACGISCRHQLRDFLDEDAKHWVEVVSAQRPT